ncbi:M48 family metallopeptidase [Sphingomonas oligophenolica]|uniref:M48 family metallopeptidase n=1 Tax=Sphingomonas oligophenolica TaxID=301154 RepID=UPI001F5014A8|nr:SprT family zinc-dependent metalloprotease [Sphingomonas oligophenolica]
MNEIDGVGGGVGIDVVRHPTARRVRLSLDPVSGRARLTVPRRAGLKAALAWAETKRDWLAEQRARLTPRLPFVAGTTLSVADRKLTIHWGPGSRRRIEIVGDTLSLSGPEATVPRRVEAWLKRQALALLTDETREYAALAGVAVARVGVGDARGRWGSCAASGAIRYSWRLILAPGWVRRATVAHEVAHRVHMNHGADFHALVAALYGSDPTPARTWLRRHGTALHGFGRES